jgi:hypothetical protein
MKRLRCFYKQKIEKVTRPLYTRTTTHPSEGGDYHTPLPPSSLTFYTFDSYAMFMLVKALHSTILFNHNNASNATYIDINNGSYAMVLEWTDYVIYTQNRFKRINKNASNAIMDQAKHFYFSYEIFTPRSKLS